MEPSTATSAAPAQPVADSPVTQTAVHAAVASGKTSEYRTARRAERVGKPLAAVTVDPSASAQATTEDAPDPLAMNRGDLVPTEAPKLSRKERDQQDANDRIRKAVESATADLRAEVARLKTPAPAQDQPKPAEATAAPDKGTPEYKRYQAMPDAPKLQDFDSIEDHGTAMSLFIAKALFAEHADAGKRQEADAARLKDFTTQIDTYSERLRKSAAADPQLKTKIAPDILQARPLSSLSPEQKKTATFANYIAETGFHSENPAALYTYLTSNEADATRIANLGSPEAVERALTLLDGKLSASAAVVPAAPKPKPKTLTDAPAPLDTLGSKATETTDPLTSAVKRGSTREYRALRRQQRADAMPKR
jgi:hypothetical protein